MPRLWNETIEEHRAQVRGAILDAATSLAAEHGLLAVTMSQIAEKAGIGRATLYKYFPDIEAILAGWHERQIAAHLEHLVRVRDEAAGATERLEAVLEAYALLAHGSRGHHDADLAAFLHRDEQVARAQQHVLAMIQDLLGDAMRAGIVRDDIRSDELAKYCLHALAAAGTLPSRAAVRRLVSITLDGVRSPA